MKQQPVSERSVVWVLGAGFSRALGAPLLADVFSRESANLVADFYADETNHAWSGDAKRVANWYEAGVWGVDVSENPERSKAGVQRARMREHAEDFLAQMDRAVVDGPKSVAYKRVAAFAEKLDYLGGVVEPQVFCTLRDAARRLMAAECSFFVHDANVEEEHWSPYREWISQLRPIDTVITFNYDTVLERLERRRFESASGKSPAPGKRLHVRLPGQEPDPDTVSVFKLHGSVDWRHADNVIMRSDGLPIALLCAPDEMCLATPGPAKHAAVSSWLRPLWNEAQKALREADVVVFVGYRFPPTDAYSRETLLRPLLGSPKVCHVVLGPDVGHRDVRCMGALLAASSQSDIRLWPMGAEDFLGRLQPGDLMTGNDDARVGPRGYVTFGR